MAKKLYRVVEIPVLTSPCRGCEQSGNGYCRLRCALLAAFQKKCDSEVTGYGISDVEDYGYTMAAY